jgi:hypothetical protein
LFIRTVTLITNIQLLYPFLGVVCALSHG